MEEREKELTGLRERFTRARGGQTLRRFQGWYQALYLQRQPLWTLTFLLVAVTLAITAQRLFDAARLAQQWDDWQAPAALGLATAVIFGLTTNRIAMERPDDTPPAISWERALPLFLPGLLIAGGSIPWFRGNTFRLTGLLALLVGIGLVLGALYLTTPKGSRGRPHSRLATGVPWEWVMVLAIAGLGAALRLYRLDEIPAELTLDQISKFWDVRDVLLGNKAPIFFEANQGREGLFFYLLAGVSQVVGLGHLAMKLTSAWIGILTIPALYLLAKEMTNWEVGTVAAFLLAASKWHIILSRLGYRAILVPLFVILVILFLVRGLRRGHLLDYGLAGLMLGLGMYSYKSFPLAVPAAVSCTLLYALRRRTRPLLGLAAMLILAALVFIPMGVYAAESWDNYIYRERLQVGFVQDKLAENELAPLQGYLINVRKAALMNNFVADPIEIYNPRFERFFGPVSAVMLILGFGYILTRLFEGRNAVPVIFAIWLLLPVVLSMFPPYEWANALRAVATIGPSLFIAALCLPVLRRAIAGVVTARLRPLELAVYPGTGSEEQVDSPPVKRFPLKPATAANAILVLLFILAMGIELRANHQSVFDLYPEQQRFGNYPLAREMAREIKNWLGTAPVYVKYSPTGIDIGLVKVYLASWGFVDRWDPDNPNSPTGYQVQTLALDQPPLSQDLPMAVFLLYPWDAEQELVTLRHRYPDHIVIERHQPDGEVAYVVFVGHE